MASNRQPFSTTEIPVTRHSKDSAKHSTLRDLPNVPLKSVSSFANEAPESVLKDDAPKICESCDLEAPLIWYCSYCGMDFCDPCWGRAGPHKPGRVGPDGLPHEKANPTIVESLKDILNPPNDAASQKTLHLEDENTKWFGIAKDEQNRPMFQDYGRYAAIMAESNTGDLQSRFPQFVSFIGQTGAGKSTLIKMLVDQQERLHGSRERGFPSPVVGSVTHGNVPTSGDVHLYSDPSTYASEYPMLLADCEGLEGGENVPISAQYLDKSSTTQENEKKDDAFKPKKLSASPLNPIRRELKWATSPELSKRQYGVTELFPRLLYSFSDVIVFVLRNPKTFESTVLSLLINWARSSIEKLLNQPTLPHAIIVLNATDTKIDPQAWDPGNATRSLMNDVANAIDRDPIYKQLKDFWVEQGKSIECMQDLLECYYSSITVLRIPGEGRYMMINTQVQILNDTIIRRCKESVHAKRKCRMLSNSETLNIFLQSAFDHFSTDLHTPFNFLDMSFKMNPIPQNFGGNILKLAVAMKAVFEQPEKIFGELSSMVASCILLDCVRQNFRGPADQLLNHYLVHCDTALISFCASYSPCAFQNNLGRCVNVQESHNKGHQNYKGILMGSGQYLSSISFDVFGNRWLKFLQQHLTKFQTDLNTRLMHTPTADELETVTKLHQANIEIFYQRLGGAQNFASHHTCFCCLRGLAEHALPCGHLLCSLCVKSYGKPHPNRSHSYLMTSCPLHQAHTIFANQLPIHFKPPLAGVRVLSLDGGGMRGIVILEVLSAVQKELGGKIPVQDFFDLIVGTSTGGIIALALGIRNVGVDPFRTTFKKLMGSAFTKRFNMGPRTGKAKYQTKPFETSLLEIFGEEAIVAGLPEDRTNGCPRKVAVTSVTETGEEAVIFANYNRVNDSQVSYRLVQHDNPDFGLKIREAARATSAAPTYFKPFVNPRTKEAFLDGAIYHNNPVRIANYESKLLWPDAEKQHPDILLSIGTAYHEQKSEAAKQSNTLKPFHEARAWYEIFKKRVGNVRVADLTWRDFRNDVVGTFSSLASERFVRVNPNLAVVVPKMDDINSMEFLVDQTRHELASPNMRALISKIAHRLLASSFYFEKIGSTSERGGIITIQGAIKCRFAAGSDNLRYLGEHITDKFFRWNFNPFFRIHEEGHKGYLEDIKLDSKILSDVILNLEFKMDTIRIPLSSRAASVAINLHLVDDPSMPELHAGFPISGFPRTLDDSPSQTSRPLRQESFLSGDDLASLNLDGDAVRKDFSAPDTDMGGARPPPASE